jgi:hypothetical protein
LPAVELSEFLQFVLPSDSSCVAKEKKDNIRKRQSNKLDPEYSLKDLIIECIEGSGIQPMLDPLCARNICFIKIIIHGVNRAIRTTCSKIHLLKFSLKPSSLDDRNSVKIKAFCAIMINMPKECTYTRKVLDTT